MDMQLPDVDGVNTTAILKQNPKTPRIPVVALTAWMSELWREKASKVGITNLAPTGPFVTFPANKQEDGTHRQIVYRPRDAEIQRIKI